MQKKSKKKCKTACAGKKMQNAKMQNMQIRINAKNAKNGSRSVFRELGAGGFSKHAQKELGAGGWDSAAGACSGSWGLEVFKNMRTMTWGLEVGIWQPERVPGAGGWRF